MPSEGHGHRLDVTEQDRGRTGPKPDYRSVSRLDGFASSQPEASLGVKCQPPRDRRTPRLVSNLERPTGRPDGKPIGKPAQNHAVAPELQACNSPSPAFARRFGELLSGLVGHRAGHDLAVQRPMISVLPCPPDGNGTRRR